MWQSGTTKLQPTLSSTNYWRNITMRKYITYHIGKKMAKVAYLMASILFLLCGCSEEIFMPSTYEGETTTISLSYSDVSPKEVTFSSRATEAEERRLDNLYIYIFDKNSQLIGYKEITNGLDQNTSSSHQAQVNGIKTRVGQAYIYAIANINTGLYPVTTSEGKVEEGKLPIGLNEEKAQNGEYNFTKDMLLDLPFIRSNHGSIQISSAFLMSGSVNNGQTVNIGSKGTITGGNVIKLNRIVSKVKFTIKAASGNKRSFKLSTYDIMNISLDGTLIGFEDGNEPYFSNSHSNITGLFRGVNDMDTEGREFFEFYLPENFQLSKSPASSWHEREDDNQSIPKVFTHAPEHGTYVVLKGKYTEVKNSITKNADVTYYVHLGDCTSDVNNYNVERNCKYTYNITVEGVDKIIVEAKKESNEQPGAEGVVLEYGSAGKNLMLDSHYEYMVMRFFQKDIKTLKANGHGYYYQVQDINGKTDPIEVTTTERGNRNGANTDWIEFAIGGYYSTNAKDRGTAVKYPGKGNKGLYSIVDFLKLLYNHADDADNTFWTEGSGNGQYIDATCFVSENYYPEMNWKEYVNDAQIRSFYVANEVEESTDGRSIYAKAAYGLQQYNIQTFYNRDLAGNITAFGCETTNDEEGKGFTANGEESQYESNGTSTWDGRANMLTDIFIKKDGETPVQYWQDLKNNKALIKACMSRNRDLNGDGIISQDEVRWYAPSIEQYAGLWIGEEVISTESKLFNRQTSTIVKDPDDRMLYYTSTNGINTFFSEEGMATNNYIPEKPNGYPPTYVRCIRNLKSNDIGYDKVPDKFYTYTETKNTNNAIQQRKVTLEKVDANALNVTGEQGELNAHTERSEGNKPALSFLIANNTYTGNNATQANVVNGVFKCYGNYSQGDKKWRVPNQREMTLMFLIDPELIRQTYCRTLFSNTNFRKSWTYNGVYTMSVSYWTTLGSVRCIKVTK